MAITPLDYIRFGIENMEWHSVIKGFQLMTGEYVILGLKSYKQGREDSVTKAQINPSIVMTKIAEFPEPKAPPVEQDMQEMVELGELEPAEPDLPTYEKKVAESLREIVQSTPSEESEEDDIPVVLDPPVPLKIEIPQTDDEVSSYIAPAKNGTAIETTEDGKVKCKRVPFIPQKQKNRFNDDLSLARKELEWDKAHPLKRSQRRAKPKGINVQCHKCNKVEEVMPSLAPRTIGGEMTLYTCNGCISGRR